MKILFHLGHPAHFHLFKNSIMALQQAGHQTLIVIKKKDVLEELLQESGFVYTNSLPEGKKKGLLDLVFTQMKQIRSIYKLAKREKVDLLCGTSAAISVVGRFLKIPSYNFNEDDAEAVPLYAKMAYPWATKIFAPRVCSVGKWKAKKVIYESYHELAYLHPDHFEASKEIAARYVNPDSTYFILRFAQLTAHHDKRIQGISDNFAQKLIELLVPFGKVYITSEKPLSKFLESYRLAVKATDIHHVMAFSQLFIGDSQTMCAESAVLGIPFLRCNDFVGRISYLEELEKIYHLGFGFKPNEQDLLVGQLKTLLSNPNLRSEFQEKRKKMLSEKIDLSTFITENILKANQKV